MLQAGPPAASTALEDGARPYAVHTAKYSSFYAGALDAPHSPTPAASLTRFFSLACCCMRTKSSVVSSKKSSGGSSSIGL